MLDKIRKMLGVKDLPEEVTPLYRGAVLTLLTVLVAIGVIVWTAVRSNEAIRSAAVGG